MDKRKIAAIGMMLILLVFYFFYLLFPLALVGPLRLSMLLEIVMSKNIR
ncbi:MAG: hypothetical protein V5A68_05780 [Candidatus Thermoplasmatota archaeon]